MVYTKAFIAESHRFSNVAPIPSPHRARVDFEIFGYAIPKVWFKTLLWTDLFLFGTS